MLRLVRSAPRIWQLGLLLAGAVLLVMVIVGSGLFHFPVPDPSCTVGSGSSLGNPGTTYLCVEEVLPGQAAPGERVLLTLADTDFNLDPYYSSDIVRSVRVRLASWIFNFGAAKDHELKAGVYEDASPFPLTSDDRPELFMGGVWHECKLPTGRFQILELTYDPATRAILHFAANFEEHCSHNGPTYRGALRWQATVGVPAAVLIPTPPPRSFTSCAEAVGAVPRTTYLCVEDRPDAAAAPRQVWLLHPEHNRFTLELQPDNGVGVRIQGQMAWELALVSGSGTLLGVREYAHAGGNFSQSDGQPKLLIKQGHQGCSDPLGRFEVLDIAADPTTSRISRLAFNFELHCGASARIGALRYQSAALGQWVTPVAGSPPPPLPPFTPTPNPAFPVP